VARIWSYRWEIPIRSPRLVATVVFLGVAIVMLAVAGTLLRDARRFASEAIAVPVVASRIALAGGHTSTVYELIYRGLVPDGGSPEQVDQVETVPVAVWEAAVRSGQVRLKREADGQGHVWQPAATLTIGMVAAIGVMFTLVALAIALPGPSSWFERQVAQLPFWTLFGSIWLTVGLPFLLLSVLFAWQDWRLSTSGSTASGTVLIKEVARSGSTPGGPTFRYTVHYRFEDADGRVREGKNEVAEPQWAGLVEQQPVPIEYVPGSSLHRVAGAHERWTLAIFGGVGLLIGGAGALIIRADWRNRRRARRLQKSGVRAFARVTSVEAARLRVNREQLWKIKYEYRDGEHRTRTGSTTVTAEEAERWKTGDTVAILLDPAMPTSTVWIGQATESPA
jgi:hypothetical protein